VPAAPLAVLLTVPPAGLVVTLIAVRACSDSSGRTYLVEPEFVVDEVVLLEMLKELEVT
jgi:hypothetical protein